MSWADRYIASASAKGQTMPPPVWPFPTKSKGEYRRVDQGWDLQYPGTTPVPVRAMQSGTLTTSSDPGGFGESYPILKLDQPIGNHAEVYYGHVFPDQAKVGKHVQRGEEIAHTGGASSGGNASGESNWLEVGFFPPGGMGSGGAMKTYLLKGKASGTPPPQNPPPGVQCPSFWSSVFGGPSGIAEYFACRAISNVPGISILARFAADPIDYLERAGLILLGGILIIIGLIVLAKGPAERVAGEASSIVGPMKGVKGSGSKGITPEQRADRNRRLALAEQNAAIGERRIAVKEAKERRLGGTF